MKKKLSKDTLLKILLVVSIITIAFIGLKYFSDISSGFLPTLGNALKSVITPFAIAFLLSFLISPLADFIEKKTGIKRNISIIIAMSIGILLVLAILSVTLTFIITQLVTVTIKLIELINSESIKNLLQSLMDLLGQTIDFSNLESIIENFENYGLTPEIALEWIQSIIGGARDIVSSIVSVGFTIVLTPVFLYYLIKDKDQIFTGLLAAFPKKSQKHVKALALGSDQAIRGYFVGHGFVMLFITIFFIITYSILSFFVPGFNLLHAILFALVMGLFSIVPYIGVWLSMALPIVLFLTLHLEATDPGYIYIIAIAMIFILNIIEEVLESTLVQPKVFSKQVKIHPLAVLSSFVFFGAIFGLVGLILAVPIAGTIKVALNYFRELNDEPQKKEMKNSETKQVEKDKVEKTNKSK
jgi:putative permease